MTDTTIQPRFTDADLQELIANYPDLWRSALSGAAQGGTNVLGLRGDIASDVLKAGESLARMIGLPDAYLNTVRPYAQSAARLVAGPSSGDLRQTAESVAGPFYTPQTPYGQTTHDLSSRLVELVGASPLGRGFKASSNNLRQWMKD